VEREGRELGRADEERRLAQERKAGQVKLSLCLINHLAMNTYEGVTCLTSAPDKTSGWLHAPVALHLTGGWVNSKAGLNTVEKRKILVPAMIYTENKQINENKRSGVATRKGWTWRVGISSFWSWHERTCDCVCLYVASSLLLRYSWVCVVFL
jgi:hypothetical protein